MNITLSIIIPVYNTAPYLRECLDSVQCQTFTDYEVWLVDDGSTDGSGVICDEYDRLDERFHVLHVPNGGVSKARNLGIERAAGFWIAFVDSDDTLLPSCFQHLMGNVKEDTDIVIAGYGGERGTRIINEDVSLEGSLMKRYFIEKKIYSQSGPCQKLFRTDVIKKNNIHFPMDIHMGEDMIFFIQYMNHVNSAELVTSDAEGKYTAAAEASKLAEEFTNKYNAASKDKQIKRTTQSQLWFILKKPEAFSHFTPISRLRPERSMHILLMRSEKSSLKGFGAIMRSSLRRTAIPAVITTIL